MKGPVQKAPNFKGPKPIKAKLTEELIPEALILRCHLFLDGIINSKCGGQWRQSVSELRIPNHPKEQRRVRDVIYD
jgi:hypothetical protein